MCGILMYGILELYVRFTCEILVLCVGLGSYVWDSGLTCGILVLCIGL